MNTDHWRARDRSLAENPHPPGTQERYEYAVAVHQVCGTPIPNATVLDTTHPSDLVDYATRPYRACLDERHPSEMAAERFGLQTSMVVKPAQDGFESIWYDDVHLDAQEQDR